MNNNERFVMVTGTDKLVIQDTYKDTQITDVIDLIKEANQIHKSRMRLKKIRAEHEEGIELWSDAVHGLLAVQELRQRAKIFDTWER